MNAQCSLAVYSIHHSVKMESIIGMTDTILKLNSHINRLKLLRSKRSRGSQNFQQMTEKHQLC